MGVNKNFLLILLFIGYLLVVFNYPITDDESTFSVIGKNLGSFDLYSDLPDNKPPGIFLTTFLLSKIPFEFFLVNRLFVLLSILVTSYFFTKTSKNLFSLKEDYFLPLFFFFITASVFYLGGAVLLTETLESLFIALAFFLFSEYLTNKKEQNHLLVLSSLSLFLAFQFKQTALLFLIFPMLYLFLERKFKSLILYFSTFVLTFIVLLIALNSVGIIDNYIKYVWLINFSERGGSRIAQLFDISFLFKKILLSGFILPILLPVFLGILHSLKSRINLTVSLLLPIMLIFCITMSIAQSTSFRYYLLELAGPLLLFLPISLSRIKSSQTFKYVIFLSAAFLLFIFIFVLLNTFGFFGGYSSFDVKSDILEIQKLSSQNSCDLILSNSVKYWYLVNGKQEYAVYSLGWRNDKNLKEEELLSILSLPNSCYVDYSTLSFYNLNEKPDSLPFSQKLSIAQFHCSCEQLLTKNSRIVLCSECN